MFEDTQKGAIFTSGKPENFKSTGCLQKRIPFKIKALSGFEYPITNAGRTSAQNVYLLKLSLSRCQDLLIINGSFFTP